MDSLMHATLAGHSDLIQPLIHHSRDDIDLRKARDRLQIVEASKVEKYMILNLKKKNLFFWLGGGDVCEALKVSGYHLTYYNTIKSLVVNNEC